jgi:hypothetical protein
MIRNLRRSIVTDIYSKILEAKEIAERLARRTAVLAKAEKNHELCLYNFFNKLHALDKRLQTMEYLVLRQELKKRHRSIPKNKDKAMFLLKLTHPSLHPKTQWKYASALRFVRRKKKSDDTVRSFMRANGSINGCDKKERKFEKERKLTHRT